MQLIPGKAVLRPDLARAGLACEALDTTDLAPRSVAAAAMARRFQIWSWTCLQICHGRVSQKGIRPRERKGRTTEGDTREKDSMTAQVPYDLCGGDGRTGFSRGWADGGWMEE
ncbi:hypothetical protein ACJRO7_005548 [Eucalyptus globulus]|uniref:Uncharacterized protein n=1 Tax=Eucalyptus globulus TaxID=34317 RepID=A0ABD3J4R7_EUCGL